LKTIRASDSEFLQLLQAGKSKLLHARRNLLENAMNQINVAISGVLSSAVNELQKVYPCYFESFRTDGVEYDVYGFKAVHLKIKL
jgi:hypothetical protein